MTYLAAQTSYRAVPLTAIVRHPGTFGLTVTLVSVPAGHVLAPFVPDDDTSDRSEPWPARDGFCARDHCQIRHHVPHA